MNSPNLNGALSFLSRLKSSNPATPPIAFSGSIVLYGAGGLGRLAAQFLQHIGSHVAFAIDRKADPLMLESFDIPVVQKANPIEHSDKIILVSTLSEPYSNIAGVLRRHGWRNITPFYDYAQNFKHRHPLNNGWFSGCLSSDDLRGITHVMTRLADRRSLGAYLQFIIWRLLRRDLIYDDAPVTTDNRYFISQITQALINQENFLDVGAYDGRVLVNLLKQTRNNIASAVLIEPDVFNRRLLEKTIKDLPPTLRNKIIVFPIVASGKSGLTSFSQGFDFASRESDISPSQLPATTLDDLRLSPTFIKIHTEGNELAVLQGAKETLVRCRPIICVTLYHSRDGLWKIPSYIMTLLDGYEFYFRAHSWCGTGSVCYAIPKDRN